MKSKTTIFLILILCAAIQAIAQTSAEEKQSARRDGTITGRVVTADGQPLSDASIIAAGVSAKLGELSQSACDEAGNFKLTGLRAGAYSIYAKMPGYVSTGSGQGSQLYRIGDHATITLIKGGVITGRVTDAAGEPLAGIRVMPNMLRDLTGRGGSQFGSPGDMDRFGRLTDDRGIYRLYGLEPGVYVVYVNGSAVPNFGISGYPRDSATYHPSSSSATATEISIHEGSETTGIDIRHRGERGHTISGTLSGELEADSLVNAVAVTLTNATTGQIETMAMSMGSRGFELIGVPNGEYEIAAVRATESNDQAASLPRKVSVKGANVSGIELKLLKLGSISGRVLIEKTKPAEVCENKESYTVEEVSLSAERQEQKDAKGFTIFSLLSVGDSDSSAPNEKGEFTLRNLALGAYRLETDLPGENWFVRSMTLPASGAAKTKTDAARSPINLKSGEKISNLEITVAAGAASLSGRVPNKEAKEGGNLPNRLRVFMIPAEATAADDVLRYRETVIEKNGSFEFKYLAPGKYRLLARSIPDTEKDPPRPAAFDQTERIRLRKEAEAANNEIELKPCQHVKDHVLRF